VIGQKMPDHRIERNYLKGSAGDAINAVLAAAGYNYRRLLAWLRRLLSVLRAMMAGLNHAGHFQLQTAQVA